MLTSRNCNQVEFYFYVTCERAFLIRRAAHVAITYRLVAETSTGCILGGSSLGKRSEPPEQTGIKAASELITAFNEGACVDQHSQDQIVVLMALADGISKVKVGKITMHTKTAIYVAEKLTKVRTK